MPESDDELIEGILGAVSEFTEAAFLMLPESEGLNESDRGITLVFLFGALDAVLHSRGFSPQKEVSILDNYLVRAFPSFTRDDRDSVIEFLLKASGDQKWTPIMQRGGQTMLDWLNGAPSAPLLLSHILRFGLEDADAMRHRQIAE